METLTYQLDSEQSGNFYDELSAFTTQYLNSRSESTINDVKRFTEFIRLSSHNTKTFDEYYLEYLTIGVLLNKYSGNAMSSGVISMAFLNTLYRNRNRIQVFKPAIDKLRGMLMTLLLKNNFIPIKINSALKFKHFINWLEATGEYTEEANRFNKWHTYFRSLDQNNVALIFENAVKAALNFEALAKNTLGIYTPNVEKFRTTRLPERRFRENYIFCGRHEVEYHLNMFGAEILNRALKQSFMATSKKVILFPTCMSKPLHGKCKAKVKESKLICTGCTPDCTINLKKKEFSGQNTDVVLIPHSSEFTKYLKGWKDQDTTGLIGVACVLNLLKGGYEMQKLNIPSQCVFLDYCGCKKHWHKDGIPTNLNGEQLKKILGEETKKINV